MFASQYFIHSSRCAAISSRSTGIGLIVASASRIHCGSPAGGMSVRAGMRRNCLGRCHQRLWRRHELVV